MSACPLEQKLSVTRRMLEAVKFVWRTTLVPKEARVDYVEQIRRRLPDAFVLHPELRLTAKAGLANGRRARPLEELLEAAASRQAELAPPFSVWLHGDFNANNVIYNPETSQLKFIDVHRSQLGDYLQDIGVFLLSMVRRPDLTKAAEADVEAINAVVEEFAWEFGRRHGDRRLERRLRLSLARSCLTSLRVIIDPAVAARLLRRGMLLLGEAVHGA